MRNERLHESPAPAMNDYMRALHQRFYREPDFSDLEEDIENTRQEVRDCLDKLQRRRLMHLVDTQNLLREETSLASFMAGFKLAWGLSKELEAGGLYSFDEEETESVLWVRGHRSWLAARRSAGHIQETRNAGQPTAVSDLPPLRRCALPVCGGALQVSSCEIGYTVTVRQMKLNYWR